MRSYPNDRRIKNVWTLHQYATPPRATGLVRPFYLGCGIIKSGYANTIFASAFFHFSGHYHGDKRRLYEIECAEGEPAFVYVRSIAYKGNGLTRVMNMISFVVNLLRATRRYAKQYGKPDLIYASSAPPTVILAGRILAWRYRAPLVGEVRDLWPETLFNYGSIKPQSALGRLLVAGERWLYRQCDELIFTFEGGRDYIVEKGWDKAGKKSIALSHIHYINNGVSIDEFDKQANEFRCTDPDLENNEIFKVVYTGSIRRVNNIGILIDAAAIIQASGSAGIRFLIWGDGNEREQLEKRCRDEGIRNVRFKGRVEKKYVPYIVRNADVNVNHLQMSPMLRYGWSQNKNFEYFAAGKPVLWTFQPAYGIIEENHMGAVSKNPSPEAIAESILKLYALSAGERAEMGENARRTAYSFDYQTLSEKLERVFDSVGRNHFDNDGEPYER